MQIATVNQQMTARLNRALSSGSDFLLAGGVLLIIAMLVIPLPPIAIDVLIALNITVAATMLLVSLYIPDATRLPSFPTILLLTTLFRLAINVSSTRLILLQGDAGHIIDGFGNFVVQGNYVVGAVVFLILVIIQFVVIAKGAERVAEVAARFTLDAMPGKQMSIDADLRNGTITPQEGARRRHALEKESQLYGAMDGAMKFVKGDAIAGIIISLINAIGGIAIGVLQQGMSAGESAQLYTLLTIGDGLVSQIPALLLTTSAGLIVTRVASDESQGSGGVAHDMLKQVLAYPRALGCVAVLLFAMGWIPGFPMTVLLPMSLLVGFIAAAAATSSATAHRTNQPAGSCAPPAERGAAAPGEPGQANAAVLPSSPFPVPLLLEFHPSLAPILTPREPQEKEQVNQLLVASWRRLTEEMGLPYPSLRIGFAVNLPVNSYSIRVFECAAAGGVTSPDQVALLTAAPTAAAKGLDATPIRLPWTTAAACAIPAAQAEQAIMQGFQTFTPRRQIFEHLTVVLRRYSAEFLGLQEARMLLNQLETNGFASLVQETLPTRLNLQQITEVLQRLLREEVPIRDLRLIMGSLARWSQKYKEPYDLAELVRRDLNRAISHRYAGGTRTLSVYTLDQEIEQMIADAVIQAPGGPCVGLAPEAEQDVVQAVIAALRPSAHPGRPPVVLTRGHVRRHVRAVLEMQYPGIPVLCHEELAPEMTVRAIGRISLDRQTAAELAA